MRFLWLLGVVAVTACSSAPSPGDGGSDASADVAPDVPLPPPDNSCSGPCPQSNIKHLVVIVQENHTFDDHFGRYCTAAAGSNPTCNDGPGCCEAAPQTDPSGAPLANLDDGAMGTFDPNHLAACETVEIDNGKMDMFATAPLLQGATCGSTSNVVTADATIIKPYWDLAAQGALADRYFQPIAGQSSSNDMYFARAAYVFTDNEEAPQGAVGVSCTLGAGAQIQYPDQTIGDLLVSGGVPWSFYAGGYADQAAATAQGGCAQRPSDCPSALNFYPCTFDPSDVPFEYYASTRDNAQYIKDDSVFFNDLANGTLPAVSFVRSVGYKSEHPGQFDKLSDGVTYVSSVVSAIETSRYREATLVVFTYDEGGGYYDHVAPPADSTVDQKPYGTRVPFLAIGPFARRNFVSHVTMEHSSVVKFIEWNFLGGKTGQLKTRDAVVNNLGSLLDPAATGATVPQN